MQHANQKYRTRNLNESGIGILVHQRNDTIYEYLLDEQITTDPFKQLRERTKLLIFHGFFCAVRLGFLSFCG